MRWVLARAGVLQVFLSSLLDGGQESGPAFVSTTFEPVLQHHYCSPPQTTGLRQRQGCLFFPIQLWPYCKSEYWWSVLSPNRERRWGPRHSLMCVQVPAPPPHSPLFPP